jgi:hypothetical protein
METKRIRVRRAYENYFTIVDLQWNFTQDEFETFKAFFEDDLVNGQYTFVITIVDPDDPTQQTVTEYGFYEEAYQFGRGDNLYNVRARMTIEEEEVGAIPEPFDPGLCGAIITEGGGTTFECYPVGVDYSENAMEPAGTGIIAVYNQNSENATYGETFQSFALGALVLGSPSSSSHLLTMYYGDGP